MQTKTQKIVFSALLASLVCVATMIIKIPSPLKGYINLGDCVVLLSGWILSPFYGFLTAGVGSGLADIFSGYVIYAPATFIIKGLMALVAHFVFKMMSKRLPALPCRILSGTLSEIAMVGGYFLFEGFLYGFIPSAVNIPPNAVQGVAGLVLGVILVRVFEKSGITK